MDPKGSKNQYSHVQSLKHDQIRILKLSPGDSETALHCDITVVSLEDRPTYDAVSYCWGSNDRCRLIWIDEKQFNVTQSALEVLQHMRSPKTARQVWIDIVCISQDDIEEKNQQVQMMRRIYSNASSTYVWLGTATEGLEDALDIIEALCTEPRDSPAFQVSGNWDKAREIFSRPWFRRLWTLQEAVLSKECIVMYGVSSCTLNDLFCFCEIWFQDRHLQKWADRSTGAKDPWTRGIAAVGTLNVVERSIRSKGILPIFSLLFLSESRECDDPRDRYYALRGVFERLHGAQAIQSAVDYKKNVSEVFTEVTKEALLDKTSAFFGLAQTHQECHREERRNAPSWVRKLPSWVPDWTFQRKVASFVPIYYSAGGTSRLEIDTSMFGPSKECLSMNGFVFSQVRSRFRKDCDDDWTPADFDELEEWTLSAECLRYRSSLQAAEALSRTLVHDLLSIRENASVHAVSKRWPKDDCALAYRPWRSPTEIQRRSELSTGSRHENKMTLEAATESLSWYHENLPGSVRGRRVAILEDGNVSLCPSSTIEDDLVVVFVGVEMPFVLRERSCTGRYRMIGPAFVDGVMDGQLMNALRNGKYQLEIFVMD